MLERFAGIRHIADYIQRKKQELSRCNADRGIQDKDSVNARCLTNIGTFRTYVYAYLQNHLMLNTDLTFIVRQLAPTQNGLPLEIYVFCKDKAWANYEAIQFDIFDHLLALAGKASRSHEAQKTQSLRKFRCPYCCRISPARGLSCIISM